MGYVRQSADPSEARPAFAQQERLRRYAAEHGHNLVAVCQDTGTAGNASRRDGYLSLLGCIAAGQVDAVLLPDLATLSSDQIVQEILLWDLRSRGVPVISADPDDLVILDAQRPPEPTRMVIRDVLQRVSEHTRALTGLGLGQPPGSPAQDPAGPPSAPEDPGDAGPVENDRA